MKAKQPGAEFRDLLGVTVLPREGDVFTDSAFIYDTRSRLQHRLCVHTSNRYLKQGERKRKCISIKPSFWIKFCNVPGFLNRYFQFLAQMNPKPPHLIPAVS